MRHSLSKRRSRSLIRLPFITLGAMSLVLSACSNSGNTTTILDTNPELFFGLPDELLTDTFFDLRDIRPVVSLSNGAVVSMIGNLQQQRWSGTINVRVDATYRVTETWVERFEDQDLPLYSRTYDLIVQKDGSTDQPTPTEYGDAFDFDGDGSSNVAERRASTNPLINENTVQNALISDIGTVNEGAESDDPGAFPSEPLADNVDTMEQNPDAASDPDTSVSADTANTGADNNLESLLQGTADVIVPRISQADAPQIDGLGVSLGTDDAFSGEWEQAVQSDISGAMLTIDNLMIDNNAETLGATPFRRWAAMHDGDYLYIVVVVDDDGQRHRHRDSGAEIFHDDSLELFLDADNSKSRQYDGNDFHWLFPLREAGANGSRTGVSSGETRGDNSSLEPVIIDFSTGPGLGPDGVRRANFEQDVYELRISLDSAKISDDAPFGFELQVNDDDDGQERESKWGWKHPARTDANVDDTNKDPSLMGTLMLE